MFAYFFTPFVYFMILAVTFCDFIERCSNTAGSGTGDVIFGTGTLPQGAYGGPIIGNWNGNLNLLTTYSDCVTYCGTPCSNFTLTQAMVDSAVLKVPSTCTGISTGQKWLTDYGYSVGTTYNYCQIYNATPTVSSSCTTAFNASQCYEINLDVSSSASTSIFDCSALTSQCVPQMLIYTRWMDLTLGTTGNSPIFLNMCFFTTTEEECVAACGGPCAFKMLVETNMTLSVCGVDYINPIAAGKYWYCDHSTSLALAVGLGVGLGVGIPVLAAVGVAVWFLWKRHMLCFKGKRGAIGNGVVQTGQVLQSTTEVGK